MFFKSVQKIARYLGKFWNKCEAKINKKIAQSGHTDWDKCCFSISLKNQVKTTQIRGRHQPPSSTLRFKRHFQKGKLKEQKMTRTLHYFRAQASNFEACRQRPLADAKIIGLPNSFISVSSVPKLGDFWKFLVTNYLSKVAKMFGDFWGILKT